ncbi:MAG: formate dehydrogenase, partial [Candidatus Angelobacter sp.]
GCCILTKRVCLHFARGLPMFKGFITQWPLLKQLRTGDWRGTGETAMSANTKNLGPKVQGCLVSRSVCPYCGVGCGQLVYHNNGKLVAIEGDPDSPVSRGRLCPKGADTFQLHTHPARLKRVKYRRPYSRNWEELDLETAMDMIADRVWQSRERTFVEKENGGYVMHTLGICHLGGATLDIEENYLIRKLFTGGLGMNCISNQARI